MNSLEYSIDALDAKGLFYNKCLTVYVEGNDDVLFWDYLFKTDHIPHSGKDIALGFKKDEQFPKSFVEQALYPIRIKVKK